MIYAGVAKKPVGTIIRNYAVNGVTQIAWAEITDSIPAAATAFAVFNGCGSGLKLSLGALGDEANHIIPYTVPPGGESLLPIELGKAQRLSAEAIIADAAVGYLIINFFA